MSSSTQASRRPASTSCTALVAAAILTLTAAGAPTSLAAESTGSSSSQPVAPAPAPGGGSATAEAKAATTIAWKTTMDDARAEAKKKGKPIIADFYTDWCGWCKRMDSTTFTDPEVVAFMNENVPAKIHAEKYAEETRKYRISSYPSYVIVSEEGELLGTVKGYREAKAFLAEMRKYLDGPGSLKELKAAYAAGTASVEQMYDLAQFHFDQQEYPQGIAVMQKIADSDLENTKGEGARATMQIGYVYYQLKDYEKAIPFFKKVDERYASSDVHPSALLGMAKSYLSTKRTAEYIATTERFLSTYPSHSLADAMRKELAKIKGE